MRDRRRRGAHAARLPRPAHDCVALRASAPQCAGVDHMDYTADGRYALVLVRIRRTDDRGRSGDREGDQDDRPAPRRDAAGRQAGSRRARCFTSPTCTRRRLDDRRAHDDGIGFITTGQARTGCIPAATRRSCTCRIESRDRQRVVRDARVVAKWRCPAAGRPDMGGVSADGTCCGCSGRYNAEVYAISTRTGRLLHRIPVGQGPHGLCVWPQPGRYSMGHTGILR